MSMKSFDNLAITGNLMELPPAKEPTLARVIEKKSILPLELTKKRSLILSKSITPNRSLSQLSSQSSKKCDTAKDQQSNKNYEDEIRKLKKRIEELEQQLKSSQKSNKEKDKIIDDLNTKLNNLVRQETALNEKINELQRYNDSLKAENDSLNLQLLMNEDLKRHNADKINDEIEKIKLNYDNIISKLKEDHLKEIKQRDEKLDLLKKQIAGAFKDNSWERQLQIDELTKELKRTQEECDLIKHKLKGYKNKYGDSCQNCASMLEKLEEKTSQVKENENLIAELVNLMKKYQNQLNLGEELLKLSNSNRLNPEYLSKFNITITKLKLKK